IFDCMGLEVRKSRRVLDRSAGEDDQGQYDAENAVFGISGACALFRASALQDVAEDGAFFDEDFFAYKEDVDLAWRMQILGHNVHIVPTATVWHERVAKSDAGGNWLTAWRARRGKSSVVNFYSTRNHGWLLMKNDDLVNVFFHTPWILPYEFAKGLGNIFSSGGWKAMGASAVKVGKMWKKRRALFARRKRTANEIRKWFV
ncbi:MAG: hypothetical protein NUV81_04205, partial [bacterium]|nr:hypothetical protein [bacterium]